MKVAALLVGDNYPGTSSSLAGCVNDIERMAAFLHRKHGTLEVRRLVDKQATSAAIADGLTWLRQPRPDFTPDLAFFVNSGHGCTVPDESGDEAKDWRFDQAIVPYDYGRKGLMLDDWLGYYYSQFDPRTLLVVHQDTCFAERADRLFTLGYRAKALDYKSLGCWARGATERSKAKVPSYQPNPNLILLAMSRKNETAADTIMDGAPCGAGTWAMLSVLEQQPQLTYAQAINRAADPLAQHGLPQRPQVCCTRPELLTRIAYT